MNDDVIQNAMNIILKAGDARNYCTDALVAISNNNYAEADELMKKANEYITEAHKIHTDAIQKDVGGQPQEYSLLFTHAQDTLMTVKSEITITKKIISIMKNNNSAIDELEKRVLNLEKKVNVDE